MMSIDDVDYLLFGAGLAFVLVTSLVLIVRSDNPWPMLVLCWLLGRRH